jgi:ATP/maltotriose-dependent transcriptional regulator MalT
MAGAVGWLQRAAQTLATVPACPEHGWLAIYQAYVHMMSGEHTEAHARVDQARRIGQAFNLQDLEHPADTKEGILLVREGRVAEGFRLMDSALTAAIAGEIHNLNAAADICCMLMYACESVRDYRRALAWSKRVEAFCRQWQIRPLFAVCRIYYAGVLLWRGAWQEAENELRVATDELVSIGSQLAHESIARMGELRRRQGRPDEASALFQQAAAHPMATLGLAYLAFDAGDYRAVIDTAERFLRRIAAEDRAERVVTNELLIRAHLKLGETEEPRRLLAESHQLVETAATLPLRAVAALSEGHLAGASGNWETARRRYEDAVDLFGQGGAPYDQARARIDLASALQQLGRFTTAEQELAAAMQECGALGALLDQRQAERQLAGLKQPVGAVTETPAGLTRREAEVLRLVALGRSNRAVAEELFLSIRTVERHITNIYGKVGAQGKAEATVFALRHGLVPDGTGTT